MGTETRRRQEASPFNEDSRPSSIARNENDERDDGNNQGAAWLTTSRGDPEFLIMGWDFGAAKRAFRRMRADQTRFSENV